MAATVKTAWETFDFNQDQVHSQIMSTLKLLFQNISLQLSQNYYSPFLQSLSSNSSLSSTTSFPSSTMGNYTVSSFLTESFISSSEPESFLHQFLPVGQIFLQSYITVLCILSSSWIINQRLILKSSILSDILELLFCLILFIPIIPFALGFFAVLGLARFFLIIYLRLSYGTKVTLLSPMDAFWACESYASCSSSVGMYVIQGSYDPTKIKERIKDSVLSELVGGKMARKIVSVLGYPCWADLDEPNSISDNIDKYIKVILDKGQVNTEDDIFELFRKVQDIPHDSNRAPWEVFIVPNFKYKNSDDPSKNNNTEQDKVKTTEDSSEPQSTAQQLYAVVFRIHHSLMDGISTANVLHSTMADKPFKFSIDPISPMGMKQPSILSTLALHFLALLSLPRVSLRNLVLQDHYTHKPYLSGPKTFLWTRPMKVDTLKKVKNATKTSVFAVLLTALGGSFRTLNISNGKTPDNVIHAMAPVAMLPYPNRRPKNRFTGIVCPVSTGGGVDSTLSTQDRLVLNHNTCHKLWNNSLGNVSATANWYFPIICGLLPLALHKLLGKSMCVKSSLSNIPGPAETVWIFEGGEIKDIAVWVPIKLCIGFGVALFTYGDRVRATVVGDRAYFPKDSDITLLRDSFEKELSAMAAACGTGDIFITE